MKIQDILDRKNEFYVKFFQWNTYTIDKFQVLVYNLFNLGYGNVKTLFKRLNMVGISKEDVLKKLDEHKERVNG